MKKIVGLSTPRAQFTGVVLLQLADTNTSIADTNIRGNEITSDASEADNPDSASAITRIVWRITLSPDE